MLDPNETVPIVLDRDQGKPPESRPTFLARYLSARERVRFVRLVDAASEALRADQYEKSDELLCQVFALGLAGWKHVKDRKGRPVDFSASLKVIDDKPTLPVLGDLLMWDEMWELERKIGSDARLTAEAKKNSGSPAPSPPDKSAATAKEPAAS